MTTPSGLPTSCHFCGMADAGAPRYHPYAACLMMMAAKNGNTVEANLRAVVEYGMRAERSGISLDAAMADISLTQRPHERA